MATTLRYLLPLFPPPVRLGSSLPPMPGPRDFSTISPSAKGLLVMKSQTTIPFAREAADLLWGPGGAELARAEMANAPMTTLGLLHFENRYQSLDDALRVHGTTRVMEIASGFSFRGLALAARESIFYLDTDLPEIVATKVDLVSKLHPSPLVGTLRVRALNALDAQAFHSAIEEIPPGTITIVNEGLLVYLDDAEKAKLAANVRAALLERGGAWITADVYVKSPVGASVLQMKEIDPSHGA
jgi:O-methyltransferase involved in polyketide biosynthesis